MNQAQDDLEDYDHDIDPKIMAEEAARADEFLFAQTAAHTAILARHPDLPPWLKSAPPKKHKAKWPTGNKSPSWFTTFAKCPRRHAQRYRYDRKDPSGLDAMVGRAIHGALEDAANMRMRPERGRGPVPAKPSHEEILFLLELQKDVILGQGMETLSRAREVVKDMPLIDLSDLVGVESLWTFYVTPGLPVSGYADLIQLREERGFRQNSPHQTLIITDYKTGESQLPTEDELELNVQATLELCWAVRKWPNARARFRIVNVARGQEVWVDWSEEMDRRTLSFCRSVSWAFQNKVEDAIVASHCVYCPYRGDCGDYGKTLKAYNPPDALDRRSIEELIEIHHSSKLIMDIAEQRKKDAAALIMQGFGQNQRKYDTARFAAYKKSRRLPQFRSESQLLSQLAELSGANEDILIDSLTKIQKKSLDTWVKTLPVTIQEQAQQIIAEHQSLSETPPWIEVREREALF